MRQKSAGHPLSRKKLKGDGTLELFLMPELSRTGAAPAQLESSGKDPIPVQ